MKARNRLLLVKCLGLMSIGCFLAFTALVLVLHVVRPQENPLSSTISDYALGPYGVLMTVGFLMRSLGAAFLDAGLVFGTTRSSCSWAGLVWLAVFAVCSLLVAIFPGAQATLRIHSLFALLGFTSLIIAALVWAHRFRRSVRWRSNGRVNLVCGLLMLLSFVSFFSSVRFAGLSERVFEVIMIVWLCSFAWQLSQHTFLEDTERLFDHVCSQVLCE